MNAPIPAQKEPYGVTVEAGKRYFWCACGRSGNQPFCDGSHQGTGLMQQLTPNDRATLIRLLKLVTEVEF